MSIPAANRQKMLPLLDEWAQAVEELLLCGLTTASQSTRQKLDVSFREASRLRLLRLSSTLRAANEEIGRFTGNNAAFSRRRLGFFLNRAWLLSHGMAQAIRDGDEKELERLVWMPAGKPLAKVEVAVIGVAKKVVSAGFCSFEFRLRALSGSEGIAEGQRLIWSVGFPLKAGADIPPEGFLHMPQKQKFTANIFLQKTSVVIERASLAFDPSGVGRITLGDESKLSSGKAVARWDRFHSWDFESALERVRGHTPGPLDLEVEMQEEVVLDEWRLGPRDGKQREGQLVFPIMRGATVMDAVVSKGVEGEALTNALETLKKRKTLPPLYGLIHYERCRIIIQPLSLLEKDGPRHLMISDAKVDRAALLKTLSF